MKKLLATVLSASFVMVMGISLVGCSPSTPKKTEEKKTTTTTTDGKKVEETKKVVETKK